MPNWQNNNNAYNHSNNVNAYGNGQNNTRTKSNVNQRNDSPAAPFFNDNFISRLFGTNTNRSAANPSNGNQTYQRTGYNMPPTRPPGSAQTNMSSARPPGNTRFNMPPGNAQANMPHGMPPGNAQANVPHGMPPGNTQAKMPFNIPPGNAQATKPPFQPSWQPGGAPADMQSAQPAMNKPLPDGVRYEPLDAEMIKLINEVKKPGQKPPDQSNTLQEETKQDKEINDIVRTAPESVEMPGFPQDSPRTLADKLEDFIQNERNAVLFYNYLSRRTTREDYRKALKDIGEESRKRHEACNMIYKNLKGQEYLPKETEINNSVSFNLGISWAITEESRSIRELSRVFEDMEDERSARSISCLIYKKISDLSILHLMNADKSVYS